MATERWKMENAFAVASLGVDIVRQGSYALRETEKGPWWGGGYPIQGPLALIAESLVMMLADAKSFQKLISGRNFFTFFQNGKTSIIYRDLSGAFRPFYFFPPGFGCRGPHDGVGDRFSRLSGSFTSGPL